MQRLRHAPLVLPGLLIAALLIMAVAVHRGGATAASMDVPTDAAPTSCLPPRADMCAPCAATDPVIHYKDAGYTAEQLRKGGLTAVQVFGAGYTVAQMRHGGFCAHLMAMAGFRAAQMKADGYALPEMRDAGYTAAQLREAGYTATQLREGGYTAAQLREGGYTVVKVKEGGYTAVQALGAGYPHHDVFSLCVSGDTLVTGDVGITETCHGVVRKYADHVQPRWFIDKAVMPFGAHVDVGTSEIWRVEWA